MLSKTYLLLPPVNQTQKNKMKKIFSFVAIAAMTSLVACGPSAEALAKLKADSAATADSLAAIANAAMEKAKADSTRMADSIAAIEAAAKMKADSIRIADSLAKVKKPGSGSNKPKAPAAPKIVPGGNGKGRPGANK
ncbi:MAG: hypothetical protein ACRCYO_04170 [Bacteroidia bacterium]